MEGLNIENTGINSLTESNIRLIIIAISLVLHILSFKKWFDNHVKYENLIDKIQVL